MSLTIVKSIVRLNNFQILYRFGLKQGSVRNITFLNSRVNESF